MPDDPSPRDPLASNLQSAVDKKLTLHEGVLMTLAGAAGEGLVVTDRRVMIVREQMPIVAGETVVDCFDYPYEQIHTVRVDGAVGGGHLKLVLITPPVDDKEVTLYFPIYDLSRFDSAAARIRMLAEQTRSIPVTAPPLELQSRRTCATCGAVAGSEWAFCGQCGAPLCAVCSQCGKALPDGVRFCVYCGVPTAEGTSTG